ncbi:MAG: hypothetical protein IJU19_04640 [Bacteroidales bacterium]|nr:hypothetical protein [Bacteroidales bacterium]
MNTPTHHQIATYLTDYALSELVSYVIEDTGVSVEEAIECVYTSPLMEALQDEDGELYVQSPAYLYELMKHPTSASTAPWPSTCATTATL